MNDHDRQGTVRLFLLDHKGRRTTTVEFSGDQLLIGRSSACDVVLTESDVSRKHAVVCREGSRVYVRDLGSTRGTTVNGNTVTGSQLLHASDVVSFGSARLELGSAAEDSRYEPLPASQAPITAGVHYDVGDQRAGSISNIGGNQYNAHVTHILQERKSVLLDVAATKTKARWIMVAGFLVAVAGMGFFAAGILRFFLQLTGALETGEMPDGTVNPFGFEIFGIPSGLIGWSVAVVGMILVIIGLVLHVMAVARRRRVDRELPLPGGHQGRKDTG